MLEPSDIRIQESPEATAREAAREWIARANRAIEERGRFYVLLSGGSTPKLLYRYLSGDSVRAQISPDCWARSYFFWGDERPVPPDHPESNYRMARETLLDYLPVPSSHIFRIPGERADPAEAAAAYEQDLRHVFHLLPGEWPRFDLALLGMGLDGHTASLFPHSDALGETSRLVVAPWVEALRSRRITLTYPVFNNARCVLLLVTGAEKAETLRHVLRGKRQPETYPVQLIRPTAGELLWFIDRPAAEQAGLV